MLYSLIHNLPLWSNKPESIRNIYTFILTTIIYIFVVIILKSKTLNNIKYSNFLQNNIYSIWAIDSIYLGISYYWKNNINSNEIPSNNEFQNKVKTELEMLHKQKNMAEEKKNIESQMRKTIFNKHGHVFSDNIKNNKTQINHKKIAPEQNKMIIQKQEKKTEKNKDEEEIQIYNENDKKNKQNSIIEVNEVNDEDNDDNDEDNKILVFENKQNCTSDGEENSNEDEILVFNDNNENKINNLENQISKDLISKENSKDDNTSILSKSEDNLPIFKLK